MTAPRIQFDRGTLRLDGAAWPSLDLPWVRFDPRTGFLRASAHRYRDLRAAAADRGLAFDDAIAPAWRRPPREEREPPALRPYQQQALAAFERFGGRGVVVMPTGAGKTRVACAAIARARTTAVVLVPTRALLEQWRGALHAALGEPIGAVGDGEATLGRVTVMTFESAFRRLDVHGHRFGLLVVDEAHHFGGGRSEALEMCAAPRRLGLTATPAAPGSAAATRLRELIGPVVFQIEIASLVGSHLAPFEIVRLHLALSPAERASYDEATAPFAALRRELRRLDPELTWIGCMQSIARMPNGRAVLTNLQRGAALAAFPSAKRSAVRELLRRHRAARSLVFTASAEDAYAVGRDALIPVITAETTRAERADVLGWFRDGKVPAIASARVLNEGIDVPEAGVAILAGGAHGDREFVQRIGRVLRPSEGKRAVVYELVTLDTSDEARARARAGRSARAPG